MRWDPDRADDVFFNQSAILYSNYYVLQIFVHRPFIPSPRRPLASAKLSLPSMTICVNAARACLRVLEGGCSVPVGVSTRLRQAAEGEPHVLKMTGAVTSLEGDKHVEHTIEAQVHTVGEAEAIGVRLAQALKETGGKEILDEIKADREQKIERAQANGEKVDA